MSDSGRSSLPKTDEERARAHDTATAAFIEAVRAADIPDLLSLYVFGSVARGEAEGLSSDIDVLVVVTDNADLHSVNEPLQEIAYSVMLNYGPPIEIHLFREHEFRTRAERGEPFVTNVLSDAKQYV
ncbi:MAG: nucleotidyltransferase domain-containing protein [Euryarchaeota archaeon]|nr:nucleotidyltransferase domain-containing protein [Euryarchaeota archaeon]